MDRITTTYTLLAVLSLFPATTRAEPPRTPMPGSPTKAPTHEQSPAVYRSAPATSKPTTALTGAQQEPAPPAPAPAGSVADGESVESYSPGSAVPDHGSAWIHPPPQFDS
jgi:hypothetical protein